MPHIIEDAPSRAVGTSLDHINNSRPPSDNNPGGIVMPPVPVFSLCAAERSRFTKLRSFWRIYVNFNQGTAKVDVSGRTASRFSSFGLTNIDFPAATGRFPIKLQEYLDRPTVDDETIKLRLVQMPWIHLSAIWLHGKEDRFWVFFPNFKLGEKRDDEEMSADDFFALITEREEKNRQAWAPINKAMKYRQPSLLAREWSKLRRYIRWYLG
jgi:hypothetical protein